MFLLGYKTVWAMEAHKRGEHAPGFVYEPSVTYAPGDWYAEKGAFLDSIRSECPICNAKAQAAKDA